MENWPWLMIGKRNFDAPVARGYLPPRTEAPDANVDSEDDPEALPRRRSEALRSLFPKLASWFETRTERARRREIEAFLSNATDITDLEERIRQVQRRSNFSHYC